MERTLSIVKPDGVRKNVIGEVISRFEKAGLKVIALKMAHLSKAEAEGFTRCTARGRFREPYGVHVLGPVALMALEGPDAIKKVRDMMGATDPAKAATGTIRKDFADSIESNIVHGSRRA